MKVYRKYYQDPHEKLKEELTFLLATALASKRKLILEYAADNGTDGLLDYADTILDAGWSAHFDRAAEILAAAAVDSALETLDASGADYSDGLVDNIERHHELLAKSQAASLLGLQYDHTHDIAIPTIIGWSLGGALLDSLAKVHEHAVAEEWPSEKLDSAITEMSAFGADKAQDMAHNALALIGGQAARTTAGATGAYEKFSETVHDERVCPKCLKNERDGWIPINHKFSGSETEDTPHHPRCRCSVSYKWLEIPERIAAFNPNHDKEGRFSGDILADVLDNHGETNDVLRSGYVLPSGKMPNMDPGNTGKRTIDHEDIDILKGYSESATDLMKKYGAVRISSDERFGGMIDAGYQPITFNQSAKLKTLINHHAGKMYVEVTSQAGETVHGKGYEFGTHHTKILGDIARAQRGEKIQSERRRLHERYTSKHRLVFCDSR
jgi:hypothetical protein